MKINKDLLMDISYRQPSKEGVMFFKSNDNGFKERRFKLCSNILFIYHDNNLGHDDNVEPNYGFIMENFIIHPDEDMPNKFTFYFLAEPETKYCFFCLNSRQTNEWFELLNQLSYRKQRLLLNSLRSQLKTITGIDPLESTPWFDKL